MQQHARLWPQRRNYWGCHPHNEAHTHACLYNEIVLDAGVWVDRLPDTIAAFVVLSTQRNTRHEAHIRSVRAAFLAEYQLSESEGYPLLSLDLSSSHTPFEVI